ncbi:nuclear transport factor 2 family protein [Pseudarthrobacter niigatensis]|uniref:SnoaL-like aldol condensation-catalyzing enzyme n=1 Tax=Pseudarthrobacter niigatensis TaxID=369935 RepID=A0AAJ1SRS1_9MICC|nr:nuclear transport factor 2 family protein [Pseudarthrobacter niigatensis]MDQ0145591.1 putative SnoaL-like aldol condensation-catalyzing enzyme [Pseudarthrobacter niigatensis]MDQ0265445.1 putative SnoaL-like aldol condensation-catalyzing enzyme [Pseudarthrobacter niigatensis]
MAGNREAFERFVEIFYTQKRVREAFGFLVADKYKQHNPTIPDGPEAAIRMLTPKFDGSPDSRFEVQRILVDGDLAMVHVRASGPGRPDAAVADIYRFEAGRIVEHWDVL